MCNPAVGPFYNPTHLSVGYKGNTMQDKLLKRPFFERWMATKEGLVILFARKQMLAKYLRNKGNHTSQKDTSQTCSSGNMFVYGNTTPLICKGAPKHWAYLSVENLLGCIAQEARWPTISITSWQTASANSHRYHRLSLRNKGFFRLPRSAWCAIDVIGQSLLWIYTQGRCREDLSVRCSPKPPITKRHPTPLEKYIKIASKRQPKQHSPLAPASAPILGHMVPW